jgi:hypothetical protein
MGAGRMGEAGQTLFKYARVQLMKDEVRPFVYGMFVAFLSLGTMSLSSNKEARQASKYLYPPKHH